MAKYYVDPDVPVQDKRMGKDLETFVERMAAKLNKNMHKNEGPVTVPLLVELLTRELGEFLRQYMEDASDPNTLDELADIANFAFLLYMKVRGNR
jgi:hypothetical protein